MIIPTVMSWSSPHTVERAHARKGKKKDLQTWGWSGGGRKVRASRQHCARFRRGGAVSRHRGLCLETEGSGGGDRKNSRCTGSPRASGNRRPRGAPSAPSRPLESGTRPPRRAAEQSPGPSSSRRVDLPPRPSLGLLHVVYKNKNAVTPVGSWRAPRFRRSRPVRSISPSSSLSACPPRARGAFLVAGFSLSASAQRLPAVISGPRDPLVIFLEKYDSL